MFAVSALLLLTALRFLVCAAAPLSADEAYYWVWSRALAPGFLDHPPMVALFIRAGTALAGPSPVGVRLLAPVAAACGSVLLFLAARDLGPEPEPAGGGRERNAVRDRRGVLAAALLNATLVLGAGSVTMTPDTPLLLFWTAVLAALGRALRADRAGRSPLRWWLLAGLASGFALDSKYTAVLPGAGLAVWLVGSAAGRAQLRRPGPWLALSVGALLFVPVLLWNGRHDWASFLKQGGRAGDWHPARALGFELELLGGQLGLLTPILFAMMALGTVRAARAGVRGAAGPALLACTVLLPAAVFVQHALGDRVQANWPALLSPAAAVAAAGFAPRFRRSGIVLGFALTACLYLQATLFLLPLPRHLDPALQRLAGWPALAADADRLAGSDGFLVADEYGLAAELAHALPGRPVFGAEPRWRFFRLPHALPAGTGLLLRTERRHDGPDPAFWDRIEPDGILVRARSGRVAERYRLFRVHLRPGLDAARRAELVRLP